MLSPEKVATPATAATVFVPDKVPVLGLVPIATVMFPVNPVAVLPLPSWAVTWTAGVIAAPATVFVGSTLKTSAVAAPPTAATVFVPDRVPVLGFVPIATVTFAVNPLAVLPLPSWAVIWTAGVISAPAVVVLGCTENTNCVAVPAVILNAVLVVLPAPVAVRV